METRSESFGWGMVADTVVVVLLAYILEKVLSYIVDHWERFRRLLFHRYFIEGTWIDLALEDGEVRAIGLTCFEIRDFQVQWHGENHDTKGNVISDFRTFTSIVDWPEIRFWFKNDPGKPTCGLLEGVAELRFELDAADRPNHYSGWACEISQTKISKVIGWKVTKRKDLKELHQAKTRAQALARIVGEYHEFRNGQASSGSEAPHNPENEKSGNHVITQFRR